MGARFEDKMSGVWEPIDADEWPEWPHFSEERLEAIGRIMEEQASTPGYLEELRTEIDAPPIDGPL